MSGGKNYIVCICMYMICASRVLVTSVRADPRSAVNNLRILKNMYNISES